MKLSTFDFVNLLFLFNCFFLLLIASSSQVGFKTVLTEKALTFLSEISKNSLLDAFIGPSAFGTLQIGKVKFNVSRVKNETSDQKSYSVIHYHEKMGLQHKIINMSMTLTTRYESEHSMGDVTFRLYDISLTALIRTNAGASGDLQLDLIECKADVDRMDAEFADGFNINYILKELYSNDAKIVLGNKLCDIEKKRFIPSMTNNFADLSVGVILFDTKNILYDVSLADQPVVGNTIFETSHKGSAFLLNSDGSKNEQVPFTAPDIQPQLNFSSNQTKMSYLYMSNYSLNTLLYFFWKTNRLSYNVSKETVNSAQQVYLKTDCNENELCAALIWPTLKNHFPNGSLEVIMVATKQPNVRILPGQLNITTHGFVQFFVKTEGKKEKTFLFSSDADLLVVVKKFRMSDFSSETRVADVRLSNFNSTLKEIDEPSFETLLMFAKEAFFEPDLSGLLKKAMVIPNILDYEMTDGDVRFEKDLIIVSTNFCNGCEEDASTSSNDVQTKTDY